MEREAPTPSGDDAVPEDVGLTEANDEPRADDVDDGHVVEETE